VQGTVTERYDLTSPKGGVSIVPSRLQEGMAVVEYAWERLPAEVIGIEG
jgi:hypothetical protein